MQIVGRTCAASGEKIVTDDGAVGCRACDEAYLREAIGGSNCPKCGVDMEVAEEQSRLADLDSNQRRLAIGRGLFLYVAVVATVVTGWGILGSIALLEEGKAHTATGLGLVVLVVVAWTGNTVARFAVGLLLALKLVLVVDAMRGAIRAVEPPPMLMGIVFVVLLTSAIVPLFIPHYHYYLDSKQTGGR